jgi:hypothetical protein
MLRETFDPDRHIGAAQLDHWVVELTLSGGVLDLRTDDTLDVLGLDDQISTSREPRVWATAQALGDVVWRGYAARQRPVPAIVYRSRTTPQHNSNVALFAHSMAEVIRTAQLRDLSGLLEAAITADGFSVEL